MIYIACGAVITIVGLLWLISPAKHPNPLYGYISYLAQVSDASFRFAQKRASGYFILFGVLQALIGMGVHWLQLDRYFLLWLLTCYLFLVGAICATEKSLKQFLLQHHQLPGDYVDPDQVKRQKTKGFKKQK